MKMTYHGCFRLSEEYVEILIIKIVVGAFIVIIVIEIRDHWNDDESAFLWFILKIIIISYFIRIKRFLHTQIITGNRAVHYKMSGVL